MLVLVGLAIPIGLISALVATVLLWLIAEITNLVFFQRFGSFLPSLLAIILDYGSSSHRSLVL